MQPAAEQDDANECGSHSRFHLLRIGIGCDVLEMDVAVLVLLAAARVCGEVLDDLPLPLVRRERWWLGRANGRYQSWRVKLKCKSAWSEQTRSFLFHSASSPLYAMRLGEIN